MDVNGKWKERKRGDQTHLNRPELTAVEVRFGLTRRVFQVNPHGFVPAHHQLAHLGIRQSIDALFVDFSHFTRQPFCAWAHHFYSYRITGPIS